VLWFATKDERMTTVIHEDANPLTIELRGGGAARLFGLPFLAIGLYLGYHLILSVYYVVTGQVPITDVLIGIPLLVIFTAAFLVPGWLLMFSRGRVEIDRVARTVDYVRDLRVYQHRARHKLTDFDRIEVDIVRTSSNVSKARVYQAELAGNRPTKVTVGLFDSAAEALAGAQRLGGMLGLPVKDLCDVEREED
jgi:hypothetical protein